MRHPPLSGLPRCFLALGLLALAALSSLGCGSGKTKQSVISGKVTYKGAPVTGGTLKFHSSTEKDATVPGSINADGTFSFGGVPPGDYTVTVETDTVRRSNAAYDMKGKTPPPGAKIPESVLNKGAYVAIPRKYNDPKQSPLKCSVTESKVIKDFELTD